MSFRRFADQDFALVGQIKLESDAAGVPLMFLPQSRYNKALTTPLNAYGNGPFCRFRIGRGLNHPGLYVLTLDGCLVYAGECANFAVRWGLSQYGAISPKNCFIGGQSTNCRINNAILAAVLAGARLELWFSVFAGTREERQRSETALIQALQPPWNRSKIK